MEQDGVDEVNGESEVRSFIVRMLLDDVDARRLAWHGQITDVRSGELRYFKTLDEIPKFIKSRLKMDG